MFTILHNNTNGHDKIYRVALVERRDIGNGDWSVYVQHGRRRIGYQPTSGHALRSIVHIRFTGRRSEALLFKGRLVREKIGSGYSVVFESGDVPDYFANRLPAFARPNLTDSAAPPPLPSVAESLRPTQPLPPMRESTNRPAAFPDPIAAASAAWASLFAA
jgi:hypothetical protein